MTTRNKERLVFVQRPAYCLHIIITNRLQSGGKKRWRWYESYYFKIQRWAFSEGGNGVLTNQVNNHDWHPMTLRVGNPHISVSWGLRSASPLVFFVLAVCKGNASSFGGAVLWTVLWNTASRMGDICRGFNDGILHTVSVREHFRMTPSIVSIEHNI